MLIRVVLKNIYSFKDETEFNLFPNKSQRLAHHKRNINGIDFLRISAIYGANGSGKSNMIKSLELLEGFISDGRISGNINNIKFKLSAANAAEPVSLGVEFSINSKSYFYSLTFDKQIILNEYLVESKKDNDALIFERSHDSHKQKIVFFEEYLANEKNQLFVEVLAEKLLKKDELLLSFLHSNYPEEFSDVGAAYEWFENKLVIIKPDAVPGGIAHLLDQSKGLMQFANSFLPTLSTGISSLTVKKNKFREFIAEENLDKMTELIDKLKQNPGTLSVMKDTKTGEEISVTLEDDELYTKRLISNHKSDIGDNVEFPLELESDGTKRLIDYLPALQGIINKERVFLIDEIERSIHPKTIKEIIAKISMDTNAKGQLIFTTHESCLLDQEILRTDEIWFAQKSLDGGSKLYPLSDFNVHHTANIENGYLNGRFGGIPFLSNLQDLNWHKYELSE